LSVVEGSVQAVMIALF